VVAELQHDEYAAGDPATLARNLAEAAELSQRAAIRLLAAADPGEPDPLNLTDVFMAATTQLLADPVGAFDARLRLWQDYTNLWRHSAAAAGGSPAEQATGNVHPVDGIRPAQAPVKPAPSDRRFSDAAWDEHPFFNFMKQSYLVSARWLEKEIGRIEGLDARTQRKIEFFARQFIDAMSPSNFILTNPEVMRTTLESNGENLVRGMHHLLEDLDRGHGQLTVRMTDLDAFEVGRNVAVTPGKVIYQNELMQLIQYSPSTETVHQRPLLFIPPWINKFYILDLRPDNSFIRWCVAQGYTVFLISWVNPDETLAGTSFEEYAFKGPLAALDAIEAATGEREVSALGYCLGGTLLSMTLAYMEAQDDHRITSATLLASQVDFSEPGDLAVFIDKPQIEALERRMEQQGGVLDGAAMANTFNMLRANDLIWSFVVNNYLLGREPLPFDLLYWNSDSTRLPGKMQSYYLRNMYLENRLVEPGALSIGGVPIDLRTVTTPFYVQAAREDHIAPSRSVFKATQAFGGPVRFMLAGSGHIAGVVNPPAANKYQHWTNTKKRRYATVEQWWADAAEASGSWWPDWERWLARRSGPQAPAREPGAGALAPIEDAPGSYVLVRS